MPQPKVLSRSFPVKAMFMEVVDRPVKDIFFDGRIHIKWVSKTVVVRSLTAHQNFSYDVLVNQRIKNGEWRNLHSEGLIVDGLCNLMQETYDLDDEIVSRLEFGYCTKIGNNGNTKIVSLRRDNELTQGEIRFDDDSSLPACPLTIHDVEVKVRYRRGDTIEQDCNCDSAYMLEAMDRVGRAIRSSYHWSLPPPRSATW